MIELILLWFGHCMGDMVLQTDFMAKFKSNFWYAMFSHVFIWTTSISIVMLYLGIFEYWKFAFLFIGHYMMDSWKSRQIRDKEHYWCMYLDQGWHFIQILIVWLL